MKSSFKKGFTLIELLVVIAVIGILAAVILASLNSARAKARDVRRISDIRTIQTALEMHYADNGRYPSSDSSCNTYTTVPNASWCNSVQKNSSGRWLVNGALSSYLPEDPVDPQPKSVADFGNVNGGTYFYFSPTAGGGGCGPGQYYLLTAGMEVASNAKATFSYCNGTTYSSGGNYRVGNSVQ